MYTVKFRTNNSSHYTLYIGYKENISTFYHLACNPQEWQGKI